MIIIRLGCIFHKLLMMDEKNYLSNESFFKKVVTLLEDKMHVNVS
jgi:hypothetical protein